MSPSVSTGQKLTVTLGVTDESELGDIILDTLPTAVGPAGTYPVGDTFSYYTAQSIRQSILVINKLARI